METGIFVFLLFLAFVLFRELGKKVVVGEFDSGRIAASFRRRDRR